MPGKIYLTAPAEPDIIFFAALGDRLVVGRRVLAPSARVRVLLPQPDLNLNFQTSNFILTFLVLSSRGPGHRPLTAETRVRISLGLPKIINNNPSAFFNKVKGELGSYAASSKKGFLAEGFSAYRHIPEAEQSDFIKKFGECFEEYFSEVF